MVHVSIDSDKAVFTVEGLDKLWAFRSRLEIPIAHIESVEADRSVARGWWHGLKMGGTNLPAVITAGTFFQHHEWIFWDVHDPEKTMVVNLRDERYRKLIIEVADPDATVVLLRRALAR
jgi:hypothetical protein